MPILKTRHANPSIAPDPRLARLLWQWLGFGLFALLVLPVARSGSPWLGSGLFWLALAPAAALITLYRHALAAAWRTGLVPRASRRRRRFGTGQARRVVAPAARRRQPLRAA